MPRLNDTLMEVQVERDIRSRTYDVRMMRNNPDPSARGLCASVTWAAADPDYSKAIPRIAFAYEEAQQLMDELYRAGLRPADHLTTAGEKEAMQAHIVSLKSEVDSLRGLLSHALGRIT